MTDEENKPSHSPFISAADWSILFAKQLRENKSFMPEKKPASKPTKKYWESNYSTYQNRK